MNNPHDLNRILQRIASDEVPNGSVDLRARIHKQLRQRQQGSARRKVLGSLAAALVLIITMIGFSSLLPQITHGNISNQQQLSTPQEAKPVSYHGIIMGRSMRPNQGNPYKVSTWYAQVWAKHPTKCVSKIMPPVANKAMGIYRCSQCHHHLVGHVQIGQGQRVRAVLYPG